MYGADLPPQYLVQLSQSFLDFIQEVENYNLSKKRKSLTNLFDDVKQLCAAGGNVSAGVESYWIDALIRYDAPSDVVLAFVDLHSAAPIAPVPIKASNGVDVDFEKIFECSQSWRYSAFVDSETQAPEIPAFDSSGWLSSASGLICAIFWCEGSARRAKVDGEQELLAARRSFLWEQLLPAFSFSLAERVKWKEAYGIPENLFPMLYRHLTELIIDCFPDQLTDFLKNVTGRSKDQLGLYSEGFRRALHVVIKEVVREEVLPSILPPVLSLLRKWRDHVLNEVENRHELVPELLRLIPLFTKLGAKEEAARLYEHLMSVSMGPTWYKEDQFDLMTTVLAQLPVGDDLGSEVVEIAACFERASGELTFQRFNLAIFAHVTKSTLESVMNCLRISNPSLPELTLVPGFESPGQRAIASILAGDFSHVIGDAESVFLNYVETVERPGRLGKERLCLIDVVAVIVPARSRRRGITLPQLQAVFTSRELPFASKAAPHETCCGLRLEPAFFGRMTPAIPLPAFEKLLGASKNAFLRINWRSGRRHENRRFGQPVSEGCLLSIKRDSLKLKESEKLAWIVRLNGEEVMMIDAQNNQLY